MREGFFFFFFLLQNLSTLWYFSTASLVNYWRQGRPSSPEHRDGITSRVMCFLCAVCSKAFLTSLYKGPSLIYLFNIKEGGIKPAGYLPLYLRSEGINTWFDRCSCSSQCVLKVGVSSNILFSFCSKYVLSMFHSWKQLLTYRCCQNGMAWTGRNCEIGGTCLQEDEPVTEVGGTCLQEDGTYNKDRKPLLVEHGGACL